MRRSDAESLYALFADTLGDGGVLLRGASATRAELEAQFARLASTSPDDTVVLAFSGHGSDTQELVTYDTNIADLPGTAFPLDLLLERFRAIPARRLICILDCCFSGGLGAKVLHTEDQTRALRSADSLLSEMAGDGRLILTASGPDEPAWENNKIGHDYLTHYLLEPSRVRSRSRRTASSPYCACSSTSPNTSGRRSRSSGARSGPPSAARSRPN